MKGLTCAALLTATFLTVVASCGTSGIVPPPFAADRAFQYLTEQVAFGPRVPGSRASSECREYFYRHFRQSGLGVDSQAFSFYDPYLSKEIPLVNVIARYDCPKQDAPRIVLMAHYDSRPRAEYAADPTRREFPIPGANDGASGAAVLMELADNFSQRAPDVSVDMVLVDGEDWGRPGDNDYYLLGSRQFARNDIHGKYRFGIVIDMIGDKDQQICREGYSQTYHPELNDLIWKTAASLGIATFVDSVRHLVLDDHLSLNAAGVPAVDIIDFDYAFWHTDQDTPDKCSPQALANVGRVLAQIIYNPSLWPKK